MRVRFSIPTFTPSRDSRCLMEEAVKALVKVPVKKEQRTRPVRIHRIPKKRPKGDLGTLSPYLREDIETDGSAEVDMKVACSQGDHSVRQVTGSSINTQQVTMPQAYDTLGLGAEVVLWPTFSHFCHVLASDVLQELQPRCSILRSAANH